MITFFPNPYEDELLYSVFSRYHIKSGNISFTETIKDLFGTSNSTASFELSTNLDKLIENMPVNSKYKVEDFTYNNTLYPYYSAFLSKERAELIYNLMRSSEGTGIYLKTGANIGTLKQKYFKFCSQCLKEDMFKYGEAYWHRVHQIKGVYICTKHNELLQESKFPISYYHKKEYVVPNSEVCLPRAVKKTFSDKELALLLKISKRVEEVLNNRFINRNLEWFIGQYKNKLMQKGLATINGVVNMRAFIEEFKNYYGENILDALDANLSIEEKTNWLKDMVRARGIAKQPIRHILLSNFLDIDINQLFNDKIEYKPFGHAPWPCLNYVCKNYMKPVVTEIDIKHNSKYNSPIGTFRCSCGFTYVRKGPDKSNEDRFKVGFIKEFGEVWERNLKELLSKGFSLKEIEKRTNSYSETLKKYAIKLGFEDYIKERCEVIPTLKEKVEKEIDIYQINEKREEWVKLLGENPRMGITELRFKDINLYEWLRKLDNEWFQENLPKRKKYKVSSKRVNWNSRDEEILSKVKNVTDELLNEEIKPIKITVSLIGRRLGLKSLLSSHLDKMPKTKEYINLVTESSKEFQIRKAKWAIRELEKEGEELKFWKVYKKASLHEEFLKEYKDEILSLMEIRD
ncbi:TnsD family Tn7-like transposition protein [Haloimpatiens massiliensis]|uniref:TnsD family Tn7-like transposition protein n=1 Tax=Haloimpatiens massiliensis TaxID=1658110 RepID=UPI000C837792|nr:TnsD family Tn7-like transposition protein [Haloimpatiens massiliensis]